MRNTENYDNDILTNDYTLTGIREKCLFNELPTFHAVNNTCVDIMHDIFEGVGKYVLCKVILNLIKSKFFSIETLNYKKQMFNYSQAEIGNISPPLDMNLLNKNNIKMSASEMMTFIHFLPLIIGDLVPLNNCDWTILISLIAIVDIVLDSSISEQKLEKLESAVVRLNSKFVEKYDTNLKPKFHFLVHYVSTIRKCGPLKGFNCFRYEAKHREFKTYARAIQSRLNIPVTLSIKAGLKFSNLLINKSFFNKNIIVGKQCLFNLETCDYFNQILFDCERNIELSFQYKTLTYMGTIFKPGYFLARELLGSVHIYEILSIASCRLNKLYIVCAEASSNFANHYQAYVINKIEQFIRIFNIENFIGPPMNKHDIKNKTYVRLKTY